MVMEEYDTCLACDEPVLPGEFHPCANPENCTDHRCPIGSTIVGWPHPVVAKEAQWCDGNILEVRTLEGPQIAKRIFTRPTAAGCTVGGVLIE